MRTARGNSTKIKQSKVKSTYNKERTVQSVKKPCQDEKRTVSIKRTVWEIFLMTLLNVPYDPKIKTIIALSYRTYNRVFRVLS